MTPGIVDFLLARIAEDEDAARRAAFGYGAGWTSVSDDAEDWSVVHADGERDMVGCEDRDVTRHIARHDPARILAECEADRRIVEAFLDAERAVATYDHDHPTDAYWQEWGNRHALALAVELLALPHADHPDYCEEWRP